MLVLVMVIGYWLLFIGYCLLFNGYRLMTQSRSGLVGQTLQMMYTHQGNHLLYGTHDLIIAAAVPYHHTA
jgi:hypothetical protein